VNGGHDLGGMHGLGPIDPEPEGSEPVFHAEWEKRVFGLVRAVGALGLWSGDQSRHARERQHPAAYLRHSYYENWLAGLEKLLLETGLVTADELSSGKAVGPVDSALQARRFAAADVVDSVLAGASAAMPADSLPRFHSGDRVRAVNRHPTGHTREPRYVRGRVGVIQEHHGSHVFPDRSAVGQKVGQHLYSVRFEAGELWGDSALGRSAVHLDLWEAYLEPA
jgi:nitrile hydratase